MHGEETAKAPVLRRERLFTGRLDAVRGVSLRRAALPGIGEVAPIVRRYLERLGLEELAHVPTGLVDVAREYELDPAAAPGDHDDRDDERAGARDLASVAVAVFLLLVAVAMAAFWFASPSGHL